MALDQLLDPVTRDYVDNPDGSWAEVDDSSTAVKCQVESWRDRWSGDPQAGSDVHFEMRSEVPTVEGVFDALQVAMSVLAQAGMISNLKITIGDVDSPNGAASFNLTWVDRATNRAGDLAYSPLGGNPTVV